MDIEKQVAELKAKHWDVSCDTSYEVQERSVNGDCWFRLGIFHTLDQAMECEMEHINKWYGDVSVDQEFPVRIVMRHTVEVVL